MKAIWIREPGGPEVLEVRDVPLPEVAAGEVRVRVRASGVNRADLLQRRGLYPPPSGYPAEIPGLEFAGTVDALGSGVEDWQVGDRVMGITGGGGYAEQVVERAETLIRAPQGLDMLDVAAIPEVFLTAFDALFRQANLGVGETVLVHAAGSGVGTAAIQLASAAGARVLGSSRTPDKLERCAGLGLDVAIHPSQQWWEDVRQVTDQRGADVILDLVGGAYLEGNVKALAQGGRQIVVGVPSGVTAELDLRSLMARRACLRGTVLRSRRTHEKAALARSFEARVVPLFESGVLRPVLDRTLPVEEAADAHALLEENRTFGKVLLDWGG